MPGLYTTIGPWTLQTFTLAVALAIVASGWVGLRATKNTTSFPLSWLIDAYLVAFVGGVIGARLVHVLLNVDYFSVNLNEAFNLAAGGLDWHGALIGGLIGLYGAARWQTRRDNSLLSTRNNFQHLLDRLTPALPLIGLGAWYGCLAAGCGYGKEVDNLANYPAFAASELVDVFGIVAPRYNTQMFGTILSAVALLLLVMFFWRGGLRGTRFWLILALMSLGMFAIGFLRGDYSPTLVGLRADQWLDVLILALSLQQSVRLPGMTRTKYINSEAEG